MRGRVEGDAGYLLVGVDTSIAVAVGLPRVSCQTTPRLWPRWPGSVLTNGQSPSQAVPTSVGAARRNGRRCVASVAATAAATDDAAAGGTADDAASAATDDVNQRHTQLRPIT